MQRLPFYSLSIFLLFTVVVRADTVLVLPFFNESNSRNIDWIGESIAETIRVVRELTSGGLGEDEPLLRARFIDYLRTGD